MSRLLSEPVDDSRVVVNLSPILAREVARALRIQLASELDRPLHDPLPSREDAGRLRTILDLCVDQLDTLAWGEPSADVWTVAPRPLLATIARELRGGGHERLANPVGWNTPEVQNVRREAPAHGPRSRRPSTRPWHCRQNSLWGRSGGCTEATFSKVGWAGSVSCGRPRFVPGEACGSSEVRPSRCADGVREAVRALRGDKMTIDVVSAAAAPDAWGSTSWRPRENAEFIPGGAQTVDPTGRSSAVRPATARIRATKKFAIAESGSAWSGWYQCQMLL